MNVEQEGPREVGPAQGPLQEAPRVAPREVAVQPSPRSRAMMSPIPVDHQKTKCIRNKRPKGKERCCNGVRKGSRHGHKRGVCKK